MTINKIEELTWILKMLQSDLSGQNWGKLGGEDTKSVDTDVFLLEHIIQYKDYSRRDVESWGKDVECRPLVNKIDDVLHVRLLRSAQEGKVDKGIAQKRLSAKYEYNDKVDMKVGGELVINILKEGANL